jgi:TctA family transporter
VDDERLAAIGEATVVVIFEGEGEGEGEAEDTLEAESEKRLPNFSIRSSSTGSAKGAVPVADANVASFINSRGNCLTALLAIFFA